MTTTKMIKKPDVVMDKEPEKESDLCACGGGTPRWYAGDGVVEEKGGVTFYRCRACGKKYT